MDTALIGAMSAVLGSLVGGSASVATTWVAQRTASKRQLAREEMRKREALYGEFIGECMKLLIDAFGHSLEKPETLLPAYALVNRIRLCASPAVLAQAEQLVRRITDQYFEPNLTLGQLHQMARSDEADPLKAFGATCRAELASMRARI